MKLNTSELEAITDTPVGKVVYGHDSLIVYENNLVDTTRWHLIHEVVFCDEAEGQFWKFTYRVGATEMQECYFEDWVTQPIKVKPVEKTIITYEPA